MSTLIQALSDADSGGKQSFYSVLVTTWQSAPIGFRLLLKKRQRHTFCRELAMAERALVRSRTEIGGLHFVKNAVAGVSSVFLRVLYRRQQEATRHPAWLLGIMTEAVKLEHELPGEHYLDPYAPCRGRDEDVLVQHSTEVPRLDDAAVPQPQRCEVIAKHSALQSFPYIYCWDRCGRKGQRCMVFARSRRGGIYGRGMNSVGVRFEDGFTMVTSGNALRKAPAAETEA